MSYKGYKASSETREKIRQAVLGRKATDATKRKMSETRKGKLLSEEAKRRIKQGIIDNRYSDEYAKKLSDTKLGEINPKSVLNAYQVVQIRQKYIPYQYSAQKLADEYGVHVSTIKDILNNRTWNHL